MKIKIALLLFLTQCVMYPPVIEKDMEVMKHLALQDKIKEWIRADCGSCHTSGLPTAKPSALQVFDFKYSDWMSRMTKKQLEKTFLARLGSIVPEKDRPIVSDALSAELYRRNRSKPF